MSVFTARMVCLSPSHDRSFPRAALVHAINGFHPVKPSLQVVTPGGRGAKDESEKKRREQDPEHDRREFDHDEVPAVKSQSRKFLAKARKDSLGHGLPEQLQRSVFPLIS